MVDVQKPYKFDPSQHERRRELSRLNAEGWPKMTRGQATRSRDEFEWLTYSFSNWLLEKQRVGE